MDRWGYLIVGLALGVVLSIVRNTAGGNSPAAMPVVATPLGYDQHGAGFENGKPMYGAALGYLGVIPSGA